MTGTDIGERQRGLARPDGRSRRCSLEYVDHLHEHFAEPDVIENRRYVAPLSPGTGAEMLSSSVERFHYPDGPAWTDHV